MLQIVMFLNYTHRFENYKQHCLSQQAQTFLQRLHDIQYWSRTFQNDIVRLKDRNVCACWCKISV